MTRSPDIALPDGAVATGRRRGPRRWSLGYALMGLPAVAFVVAFMVFPALVLLSYSVATHSSSGAIGLPLTIGNYGHILESASYRGILLNTIAVSLWTTALSVVTAYPLAISIAFGGRTLSRVTMILVVAPLVVSVIVRTYGWQILLAHGPQGVLNYTLGLFGVPPVLKILYTKWAVVIGSVHVFLPLIVLPLAGSLARIHPNVIEAARILGAPAWRAFATITVPLSLPGLTAGACIVFTLTSASYITPQMIGGTGGLMLGVLLEQQINTVYDWTMGGAIATVMVVIALAAHMVAGRLTRRRAPGAAPGGAAQ